MWRDDWSILSNHGLVLVALARKPDLRLRDLAATVGITERAAQALVTDLVAEGYLEKIKEGRRNRYVVRGDRPLRHPTTRMHEVADVLTALVPGPIVAPSKAACEALVLACSDHRYQEPLRNLVAEQGLVGRAEILLWPGGASALAGPSGAVVLDAIEVARSEGDPRRLLLVAHHDCRVPGAFTKPRRDAFITSRAVNGRRRRAIHLVRRRLGMEPELWFLDRHGASRVRPTSHLEAAS